MKPVFKTPDNPIPKLESESLKNRVKNGIEGDYRTIVNIISDLPAEAPIGFQLSDAFSNYLRLLCNVVLD